MGHERFHYNTLEEVKATARSLGVSLPFGASTDILRTPLTAGTVTFPHRLGTAPMEGADATEDGAPSSYTTRRYVREAEGGSCVIWFEAISIVEEGRSSQTQLLLTDQTLDRFQKLTETVKEAGLKANGYAPYLIMQANHSGRYSNPQNHPAPIIAYRHPELEKYRQADDSCIASDDYLKGLEEAFGKAAHLAKRAGFDAVDIKSCHGYLLAELTSAYCRPGPYGGSLENRTRLLRNGIAAAKVWEDSDFQVTTRLGIYDGYAYPYGFGVSPHSGLTPDLRESIALVEQLHRDYGIKMVNLTMGNPYATTHVTRPFDLGKYPPDEHPFQGLARMIQGIGQVKQAVPEMVVWGSAPSYLRQYADLYTAGALEEGLCDGMLFGRMAFSDPDFANEILKNGRVSPDRVCLTCGKCGDLIRAHKPTGCVIRDGDTFRGFYREYLKMKDQQGPNFRG